MPDVQDTIPHARVVVMRRMPMIAIGFAVTALVTSLIAVVVVVSRDPTPAAAAGGSRGGAVTPGEQRVAATDVARLKRDVVEKVMDAGGKVIGVRVKDDEIRKALGLEPDDVIAAISGRTIKREFDVYDAVLGMSMMDASTVYVDIVRDKRPLLLRWRLDGDLRAARRDNSGAMTRPRATGLSGSLGTNPYRTPDPPAPDPAWTNPFTPDPSADPVAPIVNAIRKIDEFHYEVPRTAIDALISNPTSTLTTGARIVPSIKNGQANGFKVYAIRPSSIWAAIGLRNGDTIHAINGLEMTSADKALEAYAKVRDADELVFSLTRYGDAEELKITIK